MSDFLNSIKITDDDKKEAMARILFIMRYSEGILSLNEILEAAESNSEVAGHHKKIKDTLNENEILATYSLAREVKISILGSSNRNKKLLDYLELDIVSVNNDNLLRFINESVKDIENLKKSNPNLKWSLQVNKIFSRLEGRDATKGEVLGYEDTNIIPSEISRVNDKIIKFPAKYLEERA